MIEPAYLAGFFDGEGTFYIGWQKKNGKQYPKAQVMLSQSGEDGYNLLNRIQQEHGGTIYHHLKAGEYKATKDAFKIYWNKEEAIVLIERLLPFLILKQEAAKQVLQYLTRAK
jgi:hypothetical protein